MTELAYMAREDWAQRGTAMPSQSEVIRAWLGSAPHVFAVTDVRKHTRDNRGADVESANYIAPEAATRKIINISDLTAPVREEKVINHAISVLHPRGQRDLDDIRVAVDARSVARLFVLIWSPRDVVRTWLDGLGAVNLHTGSAVPRPDPLMVAAGKMMVSEEYNGLGSGHGKSTVVQLVRAFAAEGYPHDVDAWLRAYFAAGGTFRHAESVAKFVKEMEAGKRHRVETRYRDNIFTIIKNRIEM